MSARGPDIDAAAAAAADAAVTVTDDIELYNGIRGLSELGARGRIGDHTTFEWDEVFVFGEGTPAADITGITGAAVIATRRYEDAGNLLVFRHAQAVVRAVSIVPDVLAADQRPWRRSVELHPRGTSTPAVLILREP